MLASLRSIADLGALDAIDAAYTAVASPPPAQSLPPPPPAFPTNRSSNGSSTAATPSNTHSRRLDASCADSNTTTYYTLVTTTITTVSEATAYFLASAELSSGLTSIQVSNALNQSLVPCEVSSVEVAVEVLLAPSPPPPTTPPPTTPPPPHSPPPTAPALDIMSDWTFLSVSLPPTSPLGLMGLDAELFLDSPNPGPAGLSQLLSGPAAAPGRAAAVANVVATLAVSVGAGVAASAAGGAAQGGAGGGPASVLSAVMAGQRFKMYSRIAGAEEEELSTEATSPSPLEIMSGSLGLVSPALLAGRGEAAARRRRLSSSVLVENATAHNSTALVNRSATLDERLQATFVDRLVSILLWMAGCCLIQYCCLLWWLLRANQRYYKWEQLHGAECQAAQESAAGGAKLDVASRVRGKQATRMRARMRREAGREAAKASRVAPLTPTPPPAPPSPPLLAEDAPAETPVHGHHVRVAPSLVEGAEMLDKNEQRLVGWEALAKVERVSRPNRLGQQWRVSDNNEERQETTQAAARLPAASAAFAPSFATPVRSKLGDTGAGATPEVLATATSTYTRSLFKRTPKKLRQPPYRSLPATLLWPNPEVLVFLVFSAGLVEAASSVLGGLAGGIPMPASSIALACVCLLMVLAFLVSQARRLVRFHTLYAEECWMALDRPEERAAMDDPLLALLHRICPCCVPLLSREKGVFIMPEQDVSEPQRTELALAEAFNCGLGFRRRIARAFFGRKLGHYANADKMTAGKRLERLHVWLGDGTASRAGIGFQLARVLVQLGLAFTTGFLFAHPYNLTDSGQKARLGLMMTLMLCASLFTAAGTANDMHNGLAIAISYALEGSAIACLIASVVVVDSGEHNAPAALMNTSSLLANASAAGGSEGAEAGAKRLACVTQALQLSMTSALLLQASLFVPLALRVYDALVVPVVLRVWHQDPGTPIEVACAVLVALVLVPVQVCSSLLGIEKQQQDLVTLSEDLAGNAVENTSSGALVGEEAATLVSDAIDEGIGQRGGEEAATLVSDVIDEGIGQRGGEEAATLVSDVIDEGIGQRGEETALAVGALTDAGLDDTVVDVASSAVGVPHNLGSGRGEEEESSVKRSR